MKILMSAYSIHPFGGSEPAVAWRLATQAAEQHQVWVVTETDSATMTEAYLAKNPIPNLTIVRFDLPGILRKINRLPLGIQFHYYLWQRFLGKFARNLHRHIRFDVTQHTTFVRYWSPSPLGTLGVPFIWGPVGGGDPPPPALAGALWASAKLHNWVRNAICVLAESDRALRDTARSSAVALACTPRTASCLEKLGAQRVESLSPVGLTDREITFFAGFPSPPIRPFRIICMGRLVYWKGFHLALRAFAAFARNETAVELWILGDGPERRRLEKLSHDLGLGSEVKFFGHVPTMEAAYDHLAQAHVLLHPALFDGFPTIVIEAMAAGKPVVCLDVSGPAEQVTPHTGIRVPATEVSETVVGIAKALEVLHKHPETAQRMGEAARERIRRVFASAVTSVRLSELYAELGRSRRTPSACRHLSYE